MKLPKSKLGFLLAAVYIFIAGLFFIYARFACLSYGADVLYCVGIEFYSAFPSILIISPIFVMDILTESVITQIYFISILINIILFYFIGSFIQRKFSSKITRAVIIGVIIIAIAILGILGARYFNKSDIFENNISTNVNNQINSRDYCQQDSDCVLTAVYKSGSCCSEGCESEAINIETKNKEKEARNKQCGIRDYGCRAYKCPLVSYTNPPFCEQNRCVDEERQSVNVNTNDNITISLNKAYYQKGETVSMAIRNNGNNKIVISNIATEKYSRSQNESGFNQWEIIDRDIECPCNAKCNKMTIIIPAGSDKTFSWQQDTDKLQAGIGGQNGLICAKADLGKYRVKIDYYEYDGKVGINKAPETIYSNEFDILEKAKNAALLTTDKKEYNRDEDVKIIIRNSLNKAIWFNSTLTTTEYKISTLSIERFYDRRWEKIVGFYSGSFLSLNKWLDQHAQKLEPGKEFILNWNQNIDWNKDKTGSYRIKLDYYTFDENFTRIPTPDGSETVPIIKNGKETWEKRKGWKEAEAEGYKQTIYSNEFIIKESKDSYRQCQTDNDCVVVSPICGNSLCAPQDKECLMNCSNVLSINKNFQDLWQRTKAYIEGNQTGIKCLPSGIMCELMPLPSFYDAICKNNLCEAVLRR